MSRMICPTIAVAMILLSGTAMAADTDALLREGAHQQKTIMSTEGGWRSMESAPRDGTIVELKNTYGVAPSYSLGRWADEAEAMGLPTTIPPGAGASTRAYSSHPIWLIIAPANQKGSYHEGDDHLMWRPYDGSVEAYVDPTGGAQDRPEYWRGAVASRYGQPLDTFEPKPRRWWWPF